MRFSCSACWSARAAAVASVKPAETLQQLDLVHRERPRCRHAEPQPLHLVEQLGQVAGPVLEAHERAEGRAVAREKLEGAGVAHHRVGVAGHAFQEGGAVLLDPRRRSRRGGAVRRRGRGRRSRRRVARPAERRSGRTACCPGRRDGAGSAPRAPTPCGGPPCRARPRGRPRACSRLRRSDGAAATMPGVTGPLRALVAASSEVWSAVAPRHSAICSRRWRALSEGGRVRCSRASGAAGPELSSARARRYKRDGPGGVGGALGERGGGVEDGHRPRRDGQEAPVRRIGRAVSLRARRRARRPGAPRRAGRGRRPPAGRRRGQMPCRPRRCTRP